LCQRVLFHGEKTTMMRDRQMRSTEKISSHIGELITLKKAEDKVKEIYSDRIKEAQTLLEKLELTNEMNKGLNDLKL